MSELTNVRDSEIRGYTDYLAQLYETDPDLADRILLLMGTLPLQIETENYYDNFDQRFDGV